VRDGGQEVGRHVRLRVLARDVSLALTPHRGSSILNTLSAVVAEIAGDSHPALALVRLEVGGSPLVARVTKRSADALYLAPGKPLYAQIKSVAILE
jgi:molybdate transport system ATP-binding protein